MDRSAAYPPLWMKLNFNVVQPEPGWNSEPALIIVDPRLNPATTRASNSSLANRSNVWHINEHPIFFFTGNGQFIATNGESMKYSVGNNSVHLESNGGYLRFAKIISFIGAIFPQNEYFTVKKGFYGGFLYRGPLNSSTG